MAVKTTYYKTYDEHYFELTEHSTGAECCVYNKECRCEEFIKGADKREIDTILGECFTYGGLYDDDIMEDVHTYAELMHYIKTGSPT